MKTRATATGLLVSLAIATGCGEKKAAPPSGSGATPESGAAGAEAAGGKAAPVAAARKDIPEAEVKALVDRWRDAQNKRDFAAYQALYATRMTGIKRVGPRVFEYDRAGWLADRGRMFKRPMVVGADAVEVKASGSSAVVRLQQSFQQGKFQDVGPKQLVVVPEAGGLRIAREEMLDSTVLSGRGAAVGDAATRYLIVEGDLLVSRDADPAWKKGPLQLSIEGGEPSHRVTTGVDPSALDPELRALQGKTFTVYGEDGKACKGTLGDMTMVAAITPHFGTVQEWQGADGPLGEGPVLSEAEIADVVWGMGHPILLGAIDCAGLVAVQGEAAGVTFEVVTDEALEESATGAFRALPAWKDIQKDFQSSGGKGRWDEHGEVPDTHAPRVVLFRDPRTRKVWAVVHAAAGEGCGRFEGMLAVVFERAGTTWKPRSAPDASHFEPTAAVDLDADGTPELLAERRLVAAGDDGFDLQDGYDYPYHDCPC